MSAVIRYRTRSPQFSRDRNLTLEDTRATTPQPGFSCLTHVRPLVPRHHVRREPPGCARLRGRWVSAAHSADRSRHPAVARQARPGQSRFTTQRREPDTVKIVSGVFPDENGRAVTTGTPIALLIENVDQRSKDYSEIKDTYRPGHADYTYDAKYGLRDYRGGGRGSPRARRRRGLRRVRSRARSCRAMIVRAALIQIGPPRSTARAGTGRPFRQIRFSARISGSVPVFESFSTTFVERLLGRRCDRSGRRKCARGPRGAGLRQARRGLRLGADGHQRREGRRDRRWLCDRRDVGRGNSDEQRIGNDGKPRFLSNHAGGISATSRPDNRSSRVSP